MFHFHILSLWNKDTRGERAAGQYPMVGFP
jgi:hypothetical protein